MVNREAIEVWANGPRPGESRNEHAKRCGELLSDYDRMMIVKTLDYLMSKRGQNGSLEH